jgi:hypothetical protein
MLTLQDAQRLVEADLRANDDFDDWIVAKSFTIERPFGWVFFYNSRAYLEGGELSSALAGNAPYIVNRHTGEVTTTGTAFPVEHYVDEYELRSRVEI